MKESKKQNEVRRTREEEDAEGVLCELKRAYRAINSLQKTPSHRRIMLDIERKMRAEKDEESGKE